MAAQPKLAGHREKRLLALLEFGENLEAACRAIQVSATAVRKKAQRDLVFAHRLNAARAHEPAPPLDWTVIAAQLEAEAPERWALPPMPWDD